MKTKKVPDTGIGEFSAKTFMLQKPKQLGHAGKEPKEPKCPERKTQIAVSLHDAQDRKMQLECHPTNFDSTNQGLQRKVILLSEFEVH